jgi:hypothetical protein
VRAAGCGCLVSAHVNPLWRLLVAAPDAPWKSCVGKCHAATSWLGAHFFLVDFSCLFEGEISIFCRINSAGFIDAAGFGLPSRTTQARRVRRAHCEGMDVYACTHPPVSICSSSSKHLHLQLPVIHYLTCPSLRYSPPTSTLVLVPASSI